MPRWLNICLIFEGFSTMPQGNMAESAKHIQKLLGLVCSLISFIRSSSMFTECLFHTIAMYVSCRLMHKSRDG